MTNTPIIRFILQDYTTQGLLLLLLITKLNDVPVLVQQDRRHETSIYQSK